MCTVSYLPTEHGFILTSNRDEAPARHAVTVAHQQRGEVQISFPQDPLSGGSWFAVSDRGTICCLLNGAREPFTPHPRYSDSRGTVVLTSFDYHDTRRFAAEYDFSRTAPFTLVLRSGDKLEQLIWDGLDTELTALDPLAPHFWSSVTLYPPPVRVWRRELFATWRAAHPVPVQDDIIDFHRYGGRGDAANDLVMNRKGKVRTLSISSVARQGDTLTFRYLDLRDPANDHLQTIDITHGVASNP
ncbi:MAG: NRDE family protein [Saprospiraceae bacterium]|nr:NRDE family protein [Saprospiraceae bacterium]